MPSMFHSLPSLRGEVAPVQPLARPGKRHTSLVCERHFQAPPSGGVGKEVGSQQKGEAQAYLLVRRLAAPRRHASLTLRPLLLR